MAIDLSCPISGEQRDNTTARAVAFFVLILSAVSLLLAIQGSPSIAAIIILLLAVDFIIRAFFSPKISPLAVISRGLVSALKLPRVLVDSAPKIFAARIGVAFTLSSGILFTLNFVTAGAIVLAVLIVCAALESFFSFCLGCWMYALLPKSIGNVLARRVYK